MSFTFNFFSGSTNFPKDAELMFYYTRNRLQHDQLDIELDEDSVTDNYGTASLQYFNRMYEYFFHNHLLDLNIYGDNNVLSDMSPVIKNYQTLIGGLVGVGIDKKLTYFETQENVQIYDISSSLPSGTNPDYIEITEVFYSSPVKSQAMYPGISGAQGLESAMVAIGSSPIFSPSNKTMMIYPSSEIYRWRKTFHTYMDLLQSDYRYELLDGNKKIRLIPAPNANISKVYFEYVDVSKSNFEANYIISPGLTPDINISYDNLNIFAKSFIIDVAFGLNLQSIGTVRSKYDTIPVPDSNVSLDGADLISRGQDIVINAWERLDRILETLRFSNLIKERQEVIDSIQEMSNIADIIIG